MTRFTTVCVLKSKQQAELLAAPPLFRAACTKPFANAFGLESFKIMHIYELNNEQALDEALLFGCKSFSRLHIKLYSIKVLFAFQTVTKNDDVIVILDKCIDSNGKRLYHVSIVRKGYSVPVFTYYKHDKQQAINCFKKIKRNIVKKDEAEWNADALVAFAKEFYDDQNV